MASLWQKLFPRMTVSAAEPNYGVDRMEKRAEKYRKVVELGLEKYRAKGGHANLPVSANARDMVQLEDEIYDKYPKYPRYTVPALSLKESSGGVRMRGSNPFGIGPGIKYPDIKTSILGGGNMGANGGPQMGLRGVILGTPKYPTKYGDFLRTGRYEDYLGRYTPQSDTRNAKIAEQVATMNQLRQYFLDAETELYPNGR